MKLFGELELSLGAKPGIITCVFGLQGQKRIENYHITCWSLHLYRYPGEVIQNGKTYPVNFGYLGFNPPESNLTYKYFNRECRYLCVLFDCGKEHPEPSKSVPAMCDLENNYPEINRTFEETIYLWADNPLWAEIKLWDLLWKISRLTEGIQTGKSEKGSVVRLVMKDIEQNLGEKLLAGELAEKYGMSHNHLNRLFNTTHGISLKQYILKRRFERARHLLLNTDLPIKVIGCECGIPDPQLFNKTIRKYLGCSPTDVRNGKTGDF